MSKYHSEIINLVQTIPDVTNDEKCDRFCAGLKHDARLEVIKSSSTTFEEAAQLALSIYSAIFSAKMSQYNRGSGSRVVAVPMEIGNMDGKHEISQWRLKYLRHNAFYTCHKAGCRPWKHGKKKLVITNPELPEEDGNGCDENNNESLRDSKKEILVQKSVKALRKDVYHECRTP